MSLGFTDRSHRAHKNKISVVSIVQTEAINQSGTRAQVFLLRLWPTPKGRTAFVDKIHNPLTYRVAINVVGQRANITASSLTLLRM